MAETVYTVNELANLWRCSTSVIYDLLTNNRLQGFKVGRSWRISDAARLHYEQTSAERPSPERNPVKRGRVPVLKIT